ncbi:retrovirus-related pol polyprotein from transposon TNT 1-94, partial [Tanacetum coccineum]
MSSFIEIHLLSCEDSSRLRAKGSRLALKWLKSEQKAPRWLILTEIIYIRLFVSERYVQGATYLNKVVQSLNRGLSVSVKIHELLVEAKHTCMKTLSMAIRSFWRMGLKLRIMVHALLLLSSLPESWSGTVTAVSGSTGTTKLTFDKRQTAGQNQEQRVEQNRGRSKSKRENTVEDRIMDYSASFHATFCKEELERFRLRSSKDVRYFSRIKRRLISVVRGGGGGQLDEERLPRSFGGPVIERLLKIVWLVARGNKRGSLYLLMYIRYGIQRSYSSGTRGLGTLSVKHMNILASKGRIPDLQKAVVGFCEPCVLGKQKKVRFVKSGNTRKLQRLELVHTDVYGPISVASIGESRYYVTFVDDNSKKVFGCDSYGKVKDVATDQLDVKCVKCTFIGYGSDEMGYRFGDAKGHKVVRSRDVIFNEDSLYGAKAATDSSNLIKPKQKDQVVLEDSPENLANDSIVAEHGLSSEITQSPGRSSYMSEGFRNSGSFEDSESSDEEGSEDVASSEEGGSETSHVRRSIR